MDGSSSSSSFLLDMLLSLGVLDPTGTFGASMVVFFAFCPRGLLPVCCSAAFDFFVQHFRMLGPSVFGLSPLAFLLFAARLAFLISFFS